MEGCKTDLGIIEYIKLNLFSSVIFHPRKFNPEEINIIWRAWVASKFLLNHLEYTIMFDPVVGIKKYSSFKFQGNI